MNRHILVSYLLLLNFSFFSVNTKEDFNSQSKTEINFIENRGQVYDQNSKTRPDILYTATDGSIVYHLKKTGICYQINTVNSLKEVTDKKTQRKRTEIQQQTFYRLDLNWVNANSNCQIVQGKVLPGYSNFYLQNNPEGILNVKSYSNITYENIYTGIDLKWYNSDGLKYDYVVKPNGDYHQIKIEIKGAECLECNEKGDLIIKTPLGKIIEQAPIVFQEGKKLSANWVIKGNIVSFEIKNLKPSVTFVIDPLVRLWGTYYGGQGHDDSQSCAADASGNVYMSGIAAPYSGTLIATSGSHQTICGGGTSDAFLVKFNSTGQRIWGTYYGGTGVEIAYSCAIDNLGNVYTAGYTHSSTSAIASAGSHQTVYGGNSDAFLIKFDPNGQRLWGTYYGGAGNEYGVSCTCDAAGNVFMAGSATSTLGTTIATSNGFLTSPNDGFLVKFNSVGQRLWGTYYYGGSSSCSCDLSGDVYLCGNADGDLNTATIGAHQTNYGGLQDAYLAKFDSGGQRLWSTFYGGANVENGVSCSTDGSGNIYLTGYASGGNTTNSGTIIVTPGTFQGVFYAGTNGFLVKFNSTGVRQWGMFCGISYPNSCATDINGNILVCGHVGSSVISGTTGGYQSLPGNGLGGVFAKYNSVGQRLWGSWYGGTGSTEISDCTTSSNGMVYITGSTKNNSVTSSITSSNGFQTTSNVGNLEDAFLAAFYDCVPDPPVTSVSGLSVCPASSFTLNAVGSGTLGWYSAAIGGSYLGGGAILSVTNITATTSFYVQDSISSCGEGSRQEIKVFVNPNPTITVIGTKSVLCSGESATLNVQGANTYSWNTGSVSYSIIITPISTTAYTVGGTDVNGCKNSQSYTQFVSGCLGLNEIEASDLFSVYPNPNNGEFTVKAQLKSNVSVTNTLGQIVYSNIQHSNPHEIMLQGQAKGLYFVVIISNNERHVFKIQLE